MSVSTFVSSCTEVAEALLEQVLRGDSPDPRLVRFLARETCSQELFRIVVEGLADRFEPRLCQAYSALFSEVIEQVIPDRQAEKIRETYSRVCVPRVCRETAEHVYILSRVTLGADIAVTSVLMNAAKRRFPRSRIVFVGNSKNAELWAADPRVEHAAAPYTRNGSLQERLSTSDSLWRLLQPSGFVLDPDSRLTQLGLMPACEEENYFFFESRGYGGNRSASLQELAAEWCSEVLEVEGATAYLALPPTKRTQQTAISFGIGENPAKRLGDAFETELLRAIEGRILIDAGAGGEEAERVQRAVAASGADAEIWRGSFAGFAARIAESSLYIGYDSAGQHAAAALGTPLVTVFAGHVCERMFQRWKPTGAAPIEVIDAETLTAEEALSHTLEAVRRIRTA